MEIEVKAYCEDGKQDVLSEFLKSLKDKNDAKKSENLSECCSYKEENSVLLPLNF